MPGLPLLRLLPAGPRELTRSTRIRTWAAIFAVVFAIHVVSPNAVVSDSMRVVPVAMSMLDRGTISLDHYHDADQAAGPTWPGPAPVPGYAVDEANGHYLPAFPWTVSLFLLPVVVPVEVAHRLGVGPGVEADSVARNSDWPYQVVAMSLVVAATAVVLFETALALLATLADRRRWSVAVATSLVFAFATPAWSTASRSAWQHGPSMLLLSIALLVAARGRSDDRWLSWIGVPLAAAYTLRPTNAIVVVALGVWVLVHHRHRVIAAGGGGVVVLGGWGLVNLRAWGEVLPPYFAGGRLGDNPDFGQALAANLVSPARGLFIFSPILVLGTVSFAWRAIRREASGLEWALAAAFLAHWIAISAFPHWWGGDSFGPRFFTDMAPLLLVLAMPLVARLVAPDATWHRLHRVVVAAVAMLIVWSVAVHAQGALFRASYCWNDQPREIDEHPERVWDWRHPQLLAGWRSVDDGGDPGPLTRGGIAAVGCPSS